MGIDYVKLGYDNAKEEAEMEAKLLAIVNADMAKPRVYIPTEPINEPSPPLTTTIFVHAPIVAGYYVIKFIIVIFLLSLMVSVLDFAMGGYYD